MKILGIDPGSIVTGFGLIEESRGKMTHIDNGGIFPPKNRAFSERLCHIHDEVESLLHKYRPDAVAIENIFVAKNVSSTLKLGQARGAAVLAVARSRLPLHEYTANEVKLAVTGYGHAGKTQIQKMVCTLLKLPEHAFTDASDALAVAICHLNSYRLLKKVSNR